MFLLYKHLIIIKPDFEAKKVETAIFLVKFFFASVTNRINGITELKLKGQVNACDVNLAINNQH